MKQPPKVLFVTAALEAVGGIPSYSRGMIEALHDCSNVRFVNLELSGGRADQLRAFARVVAEIGRFRPDLLLLGHVGFGPIGLLWKAVGGRYAIVVYGIDVWGPPHKVQVESLLRADRVWPISTFTGVEALRTAPGSRLGPILGGNIDEGFFQEHEAVDGPFRALVVCRLEDLKYKGVDTAIDAVQLVHVRGDARRPIELRIVGSGPAREELDRLIVERDGAGVVNVLGRVSNEDLLAEYRRADVLLLVSRHQRGVDPRGEGLGLVVLEAGAAGTPSIASFEGGSTDIVVDGVTGFLVTPGDAGVVADRIVDLMSDRERAAEMGRAARALAADEHTVKSFSRRVKDALESTLG